MTSGGGNQVSDNRPRGPSWLSAAKGLSLLTQLGIQIVIPIVAGVMAGAYLERRTGSLLWSLAGVLLGVFAGLWNGFRMMWRSIQDPKDR